jgi:hypothetical protein
MAKRSATNRVAAAPAIRLLLKGSEIQAKWTLERCGISTQTILKLIRDSRHPNFDSGLYKASTLREPLSRQLWIVSAEMFYQINRCKQALRKARFIEAIESAWLLGESRGSLFRMSAKMEAGRKNAKKSAQAKNLKWQTIMRTATEIYLRELAAASGAPVKGEYLHSKVRSQLEGEFDPFPAYSTFAGHWSPLQAKMNSE